MSNNGIKRYASEKYVDDKIKLLGTQSDWNQNDESASDYIKNRPFYENKEIIDKSGMEYIVYGLDKYTGTIPFEKGQKWALYTKIPVSDDYKLFAEGLEVQESENGYYVGSETLTAPHWYCLYSDSSFTYSEQWKSTIGWDKVKFVCTEWIETKTEIIQIDEKFIPDTIARVENLFDGIYLRDIENGLLYLVQMKGGNLVSSSRTISIQVSKDPDKMIYDEGETFDPTGMIVSTVCEDGTQKIITNYTYSDMVDNVVTITYVEGKETFTTTISVTINRLEDKLIDFEYVKNEDGTYTLNKWKGTLNGEPSTEMVFPDSELIIM